MKDAILREIGKVIIPFIQIFGIYIIFNGHLSPGGGFSGGTILGVSFIMHKLIEDPSKPSIKISEKTIMQFMCFSLILYGILKGYSFISGGGELEVLNIPLGVPGRILSGGMLLPLNIAVGIIVCFTIYTFYTLFDKGEI
jgi:multicomponent Na+:H+ antiporter subunit B